VAGVMGQGRLARVEAMGVVGASGCTMGATRRGDLGAGATVGGVCATVVGVSMVGGIGTGGGCGGGATGAGCGVVGGRVARLRS